VLNVPNIEFRQGGRRRAEPNRTGEASPPTRRSTPRWPCSARSRSPDEQVAGAV